MTGEHNPGRSIRKEGPMLSGPPFYLPEFEESFRYIIDEYDIPPRDVAIFIPCAMKKPYRTSPSHRIMRSVIANIFTPEQYHIVIFGTCGIVPSELEEMYPYAHYRYMLGKCEDEGIKEDFLRIEANRVAEYMGKTRDSYRYRVGYCIGGFRQALTEGSRISGVPLDLVIPSEDLINQVIEEEDCPFQEGSLMMEKYLDEFNRGLRAIKDLLGRENQAG